MKEQLTVAENKTKQTKTLKVKIRVSDVAAAHQHQLKQNPTEYWTKPAVQAAPQSSVLAMGSGWRHHQQKHTENLH